MWLEPEKLKQTLDEKGCYHTPDVVERSIGDRLFGNCDFWFHKLALTAISLGCFRAYTGKFDRWCWSRYGLRIVTAIERCGGEVHIEGAANLDKLDGPAVFVANHMSMLETLILPGLVLLYTDSTIIVKQALIDRPFFGEIMRSVGALGVGRTDPRQDLKVMLGGGAEALKQGKSIMIFPQSTRLPIFDRSKFNSIGVKIASKAGVPVVPVALKTDFQGVGKVVKDFGPVDRSQKVMFAFGEPMPPTMNRKEIHAKSIDFIESSLKSWGAELADSSDAEGEKHEQR
jgi:1-acyl-sn-glycerol-3-phosphate acyltransferase